GSQVPEHAHGADQLIYAITGMMEVSSGTSVWVIPPDFALWIPAETPHRIRMDGMVRMRTLYFRPGIVARAPAGGAVIYVSSLLRELILEAVRIEKLRIQNPYECAVREMLAHHLEQAVPAPTYVTMPRDARARSVAQAILASPA